MVITFTTLILWLIVSAAVGLIGELIARRRAPDGILGAIVLGFLGIFLIVYVFHFHIDGEPTVGGRLTEGGIPLISSIIAAVILVILWSGFAYRGYRRGYERYYRRGTYVRRPRARRRFRFF